MTILDLLLIILVLGALGGGFGIFALGNWLGLLIVAVIVLAIVRSNNTKI